MEEFWSEMEWKPAFPSWIALSSVARNRLQPASRAILGLNRIYILRLGLESATKSGALHTELTHWLTQSHSDRNFILIFQTVAVDPIGLKIPR